VHRKGLANSDDLAPKSPNDQKLDMSTLCSKQSIYSLVAPKLIQSCYKYVSRFRMHIIISQTRNQSSEPNLSIMLTANIMQTTDMNSTKTVYKLTFHNCWLFKESQVFHDKKRTYFDNVHSVQYAKIDNDKKKLWNNLLHDVCVKKACDFEM